MKTFSWAGIAVLFLQGLPAGADDIVGVFVEKDATWNRVEFCAKGKFFSSRSGARDGSFAERDGALICNHGDDQWSFRRDGKALIDENGAQWLPREELAKLPWQDAKPVKIAVVDSNTKQPITEFGYVYTISTPDAEYSPLLVRPVEVRAPDGTFILLAPASCEIGMHISGENILGGYGTWRSYHLKSENKERKISVFAEVGDVIEGTVVDAQTQAPIEGVRVAPVVFSPPLFSPDKDRAVKTDAKGRFLVKGVDTRWGINIWHADFNECERSKFDRPFEKTQHGTLSTRIELTAGETFFGTVKDETGAPLSDVEISDQAGKEIRSSKDGAFVLKSPRKSPFDDAYNLSFEKEGYLNQRFSAKSATPDGLSIVLERQPVLEARVLDPDGSPVTTFVASAGIGLEPRPWKCTTKKGEHPGGRFTAGIRTDRDYAKEGKVWIAVKAPGFALTETTVDTWKGTHALDLVLRRGVSVSGSILAGTPVTGGVIARLLPICLHEEQHSRDTSKRQKLGQMEAAVDEKGAFQFQNVAAGPYLLAIGGPGIAPTSRGIAVSNSDIQLEALRLAGCGRIVGVAYSPATICENGVCRLDPNRGVWAFADGDVYVRNSIRGSGSDELTQFRPIHFKTDERGRFQVEGIPAGTVSVSFPFNISADIIGGHSRSARVVEDHETELRFFDTSGNWEVPLQFLVGDGSAGQFSSGSGMGADRKVNNVTTRDPMFRVELIPDDSQPASYCAADWEELDKNKQIILHDVQPGRYRLLINDWLMSIGFRETLYEARVEIKPKSAPIRIPLGAGCITGGVKWTTDYRHMIHVLAIGRKTRAIRHAHCDGDGSFCVRYLPPDTYTLYAHDYDAGWLRFPETAVNNAICEIGVHQLQPGGTIAARIPQHLTADESVKVVVVDMNGLTIAGPDFRQQAANEFDISGLWPGRWVVSLRHGERTLASKTVELRRTETVACYLADE